MSNKNSIDSYQIMLFRLLSTCRPHQIVTLIAVLAVFTEGVPVKKPLAPQWTTHNMTLWEDIILLSSDSDHQPLLMTNHTGFYTAPDIEKMENETLTQFQILKANYTYNVNGNSSKEDGSASQAELYQFVYKSLKLLNLNQVVGEVKNSFTSEIMCYACEISAGVLQYNVKHGYTRDQIAEFTYQFCMTFKIQTPRVCKGITELYSGEVVYILQKVDIGPKQICSFVIGEACGDVYSPTHDWNVVFPPVPKPTPVEAKILKEPVPRLKVLHLSDNHFDPYYEEGTNADCNEPLCCRLTSGPATNPQNRAGKWGDYRKCDTPKRTIDSMLQHIVDTHNDIDYIIWTGDLPAHDIWNQTKEENLFILKESVAQLVKMFPGIPIFPALGNHESVPVNSFPPPSSVDQPEFVIDWLYSELDTQWRRWLPGSVSKTIKRGAFYSVLVRPGFRIISLNMNYCNNLNWWLLINSTDPVNELQWFIYELQNAEINGEKVHVLGHIPPGHSDCLKVWSRNYYSIISRYESTITAQFFGHTHFDEFELFYDTQNLSRPISIAYIGPSVTSYDDLNPGYRIYYVDGDRENSTRTVLDHETWVMNLKEANLYNYPNWQKLYSTRAAYKLPSLRPVDWDKFICNLAEDQTTFDLYYKHYWKNSPTRPTCDAECKINMICDLRNGRSHDRKILCKGIESSTDAGGWINWLARLYDGFTALISMIGRM